MVDGGLISDAIDAVFKKELAAFPSALVAKDNEAGNPSFAKPAIPVVCKFGFGLGIGMQNVNLLLMMESRIYQLLMALVKIIVLFV